LDTLLVNELFSGLESKNVSAKAKESGCDLCYLIAHSSTRPPEKSIFPLTNTGKFQFELTCMFPPNSGSKCPQILKHVKQKWQSNAIKLGDRPTQYANTPSCDKYSAFGKRCFFHSMQQL